MRRATVRSLLASVAVVGIVSATAASSAQANGSIPYERVTLDASKGTASTDLPLLPKLTYTIKVQGTYSAYLASLWNQPAGSYFVTCGTTERAPMFPSPGANGPVGADAETLFAGIATLGCGNFKPPLQQDKFQVDYGDGPVNLVPVGGDPTTPSADHTYYYKLTVPRVIRRLTFKLKDDSYTDNYGQLKITMSVGLV